MNQCRRTFRLLIVAGAVACLGGCMTAHPPHGGSGAGQWGQRFPPGQRVFQSPDDVSPADVVVRGQAPGYPTTMANQLTPGSPGYFRQPMTASGTPTAPAGATYPPTAVAAAPVQGVATGAALPAGNVPANYPAYQPAPYNTTQPLTAPYTAGQPVVGPSGPPGNVILPPGARAPIQGPGTLPPPVFDLRHEDMPAGPFADIIARLEETQTGRLMFGVGVNSDLGLTGQIVIDERNFDIAHPPRSWYELWNGQGWRGGGQGFRVEAYPGTEVQRYTVSFTEPYLMQTPVSLSLSGFFYDRNYFDWDEQRLGGRIGLGYRITHDLSLVVSSRIQDVDIHDPRVPGVPELDAALGKNSLYSLRLALTHDTRDVPFAPTQGHMIELAFEQVFGSFDYPRGEIDYRQYFLIRERPDQSGRHTLGYSFRFGFTGSNTPIYENFFAGGFSSLRGFDYRGASPQNMGVIVGGEFMMLGSAEYTFPITADDMLRGVAFVDFGTVEEKIEINPEDYRVSVGAGLRISVPAMGPAPIALDFGFPIAKEDTDDEEMFSFYIGFIR